MSPFEVGARVRSKRIGSRAAFTGKVVNVFKSGAGHWCFDVEDGEGRLWLRSASELSAA